MTAARCHGCEAPLAAEQRWCVICGARQAGADPRTLLFGAPQPPAAAVPPRPEGSGSSDGPALRATQHRQAGSDPSGPDPALLAARRRRAALPVALASLVGLVVVTGTSVPASLAGSSPLPFTVVLPAQVAQAPPPTAEPVAPPVEEQVEPAVEEPPVVEPAVVETPVAQTPAAEQEVAADETDTKETPPAETPADDASPIRHVFLIALGAADVNALARDTAAAPYLAGTLAKSGTLLSDYRTVARGGLANRIALISGQGPTTQTLDDCTTFGDVRPADALANGQTGGDGCVYGAETGHLGDQLQGLERTWKAYVEPAAGASRAGDAGRGPIAHAAVACDSDAETTRRNPFLWFRGTFEADDCDERNVPLARLKKDLRKAETTPALAWIASDAQQGSADADRFLERVVPQIQDSPAYADGGLIVIVGDQPPAPGDTPAPPAPADGQTTPAPPAPTTPSDPAPAATTPAAPAATTPTTTPTEPPTATTPQSTTAQPPPAAAPAGRALALTTYANVGDAAAAGAGIPVGALLISSHTPSGKVDKTPANAFTLLRTLQQIYGVDPLGYAAADGVVPLSDDLFSVEP